MSTKLTKEEKKILDSYENEEWVSVSTPARLKKYKEAAKNTFKKNKRVNIRISEIDFSSFPRSRVGMQRELEK